jgi:hypothetical protein
VSLRAEAATRLLAAAHAAHGLANALDHFLQSGIYEGRHAVNDGMWH